MGNNITHFFRANDQDYKFVIKIWGFDNDLICYDFYKKYKMFGLITCWENINLKTKTKRTIFDAKNTIDWDIEKYISKGIEIWEDRISNGREEFIMLTKQR
tara:strand:+ start:70 stop:372 length:303 start_codon:yes stop_codon:yes gene_type:complete